jgi:hypothetical protein
MGLFVDYISGIGLLVVYWHCKHETWNLLVGIRQPSDDMVEPRGWFADACQMRLHVLANSQGCSRTDEYVLQNVLKRYKASCHE